MANPTLKNDNEKNKPAGNEGVFAHAERTVEDTANKVIGSVGPAIKQGYEEAEKAVTSAIEATEEAVKKYPFQTVLISFGVGCLLGVGARSLFANNRA